MGSRRRVAGGGGRLVVTAQAGRHYSERRNRESSLVNELSQAASGSPHISSRDGPWRSSSLVLPLAWSRNSSRTLILAVLPAPAIPPISACATSSSSSMTSLKATSTGVR